MMLQSYNYAESDGSIFLEEVRGSNSLSVDYRSLRFTGELENQGEGLR